MVTKTNLAEVKTVLKKLFDGFDTEPTEFGIVSHPFTNSIGVNIKTKDGFSIGDLREPDVKAQWRKEWFNKIDAMGIKDIESMFYMGINKPYLLTVLMFCRPFMKNSLFSELLADAWVRSENPNGDVNVDITTLIEWFKDANKDALMEPEDKEYFENLPDTITVYRGVSKGRNKYGLSWTDSKEKAEWFRDRWKNFDEENERYLMTATIPKKYALCYFNTRDEMEVVVDTDALFSDDSIKIHYEYI